MPERWQEWAGFALGLGIQALEPGFRDRLADVDIAHNRPSTKLSFGLSPVEVAGVAGPALVRPASSIGSYFLTVQIVAAYSARPGTSPTAVSAPVAITSRSYSRLRPSASATDRCPGSTATTSP